MNIKNEIVVGIDVGLTSAVCIVDKNLNVLFLKSKREYKKSEMIDDILKFGKPLLICCDVPKVPKKILKIAKSLGSKIFHPTKVISEEKKKRLTYGYEYKNWHERDALFAAIVGMKSIRKKLLKEKRVEKEIKNEKIEESLTKISKDKESEKIKLLAQKIKSLKDEIKKLKERISELKKEKIIVKYEYREVENENLKIENEALKLVIKILKLELSEEEIPYVFLEEIDERILKILKEYIEDFVVISNQVEKFYILEKFDIKFVITSKDVENVWNLKLIKDDISKYEKIGKISIKYLEEKWKERLQELLKNF